MQNFLPRLMQVRSGAKLEHAAWIRGSDHRGIRAFRVAHLDFQQIERSFRLCDVVDPGRSAALIRKRHFDQLEAGNGAQKFARSFRDFLAVQEMAGILVSDAKRKALQRRGEADFGEEFGYVFHLLLEGFGLHVFGSARTKKLRVLLERRTASCGVCENGVERLGEERRHVCAREIACDIAHSGMNGQRSAAELASGDDDLAAVGLEDANRRIVQFGETDLRDAAGKKCYSGAANTLGGKRFSETREKELVACAGHQTIGIGNAEQAKHAASSRQTLQAGALVEAGEAARNGDTRRIREKFAINEIAREPREKRAAVIFRDLAARGFDQLAVFDSRRTRALAGAAIEASVHVVHERVTERETPLIHKLHLANATARRIGFEAPQAIRRAMVQAEAAVDAAGVVVVTGLVGTVKAARDAGIVQSLFHAFKSLPRIGRDSRLRRDRRPFSHATSARNRRRPVPKLKCAA